MVNSWWNNLERNKPIGDNNGNWYAIDVSGYRSGEGNRLSIAANYAGRIYLGTQYKIWAKTKEN